MPNETIDTDEAIRIARKMLEDIDKAIGPMKPSLKYPTQKAMKSAKKRDREFLENARPTHIICPKCEMILCDKKYAKPEVWCPRCQIKVA